MFGFGDEFDIDDNFLKEVFEVERASSSASNQSRNNYSCSDSSQLNFLKTPVHSSSFVPHQNNSASNVFNDKLPNTNNAIDAIVISHRPKHGILSKQCSSRQVRPRKFPGPAGLLPERQGNSSLIATEDFLDELEEELKEETKFKEDEILSQDSARSLDNPAWAEAIKDLGPNAQELLKRLNVASVCARAKQTKTLKVPFLALLIQNVDASTADPCLYLSDTTGEMVGAVHRNVWEQLGQDLIAGTVIVLINVGILCAGNSSCRHYLNITTNNIASIYSPTNGNDIRVTNMKPLSHPDCSKFLKMWQDLLSTPIQQVSQPLLETGRQLFTTAAFSPVPILTQRKQNFSNKYRSNTANRSYNLSFNSDNSIELNSPLQFKQIPSNYSGNFLNQGVSQSPYSQTGTPIVSTPSNSFSGHTRMPSSSFVIKRPRFDFPQQQAPICDQLSSQGGGTSQSIVESALDGIDTDSFFGDF